MEDNRYRRRTKRTIKDFCYNENMIRNFNLVGFMEEYKGEKQMYRCESCGIEQMNSGLEFELDNPQIWVSDESSDTSGKPREAPQ